jgi:multicomponent K+:H+ antiporter subunit D
LSSGTLLAALGVGSVPVTAAALYYMATATLGVALLFLLVELLQRTGETGQARLQDVDFLPGEDTNLDDEEMPLVGREFSVSLALLGLAFLCAVVLVAGLPPLSGFLAKASLLNALVQSQASSGTSGGWWLFGLLLLSGLTATISFARAGIHRLWSAAGQSAPRLKGVEAAAVLALIGACVLLTAFAEPVMRYASITAAGLHAPNHYIEAVLSRRARPSPTQSPVQAETAP